MLANLVIWDPEEIEDAETISDSLTALGHLTSLILIWSFPSAPDSLPHLTSLRRLSLHSWGQANEEESLQPLGSWSHGLQELGIGVGVAFRSLETLRSMTALEWLRLYCSPSDFNDAQASRWGGLLTAAGSFTQLQRLDIESDCDEDLVMGFHVAGSLLALQRLNPRIVITPRHVDCLGDWDMD